MSFFLSFFLSFLFIYLPIRLFIHLCIYSSFPEFLLFLFLPFLKLFIYIYPSLFLSFIPSLSSLFTRTLPHPWCPFFSLVVCKFSLNSLTLQYCKSWASAIKILFKPRSAVHKHNPQRLRSYPRMQCFFLCFLIAFQCRTGSNIK